jgi:hypothetical protein
MIYLHYVGKLENDIFVEPPVLVSAETIFPDGRVLDPNDRYTYSDLCRELELEVSCLSYRFIKICKNCIIPEYKKPSYPLATYLEDEDLFILIGHKNEQPIMFFSISEE